MLSRLFCCNGQRVKKVVNGITTIFHYNLSGQLIAESNNGGSITAEYVYLNGSPLAKIEGTNTYYYHNDHLGTPQKLTDSTGQVVWEGEFKPFGEAISVTGTITNNMRFPGQYFDAETGLHYNYFRDYNPVIGRYVQADPIFEILDIYREIFTVSISDKKIMRHTTRKRKQMSRMILAHFYKINPTNSHKYLYARQNPISYIDISGLSSCHTVCNVTCNLLWYTFAYGACGLTTGPAAFICGAALTTTAYFHCTTMCDDLCDPNNNTCDDDERGWPYDIDMDDI